MKNFKKLLCLVFCISLCFACADFNEDVTNDLKSGKYGSGKDGDVKMVTVPFKVHYLGTYMPPGDKCPGTTNVIVHGVGEGTHVGVSTIHFDFCILGATASGDSIFYGNTDAYIIADNGDSLFVSIEGAVVSPPLDDHPDYVVNYWRDEFVILGGSGRFAGATGGGWSDDYNSTEDNNSHHYWEGTITMLKGKR
ncbi:hypothetical protein [Draconibacterium halophilum]|uniref:Lipoprotein n=1 Tax=Draconibacterium halophilum TaxID=2706887 RepID=A0A6C0RDN1_9BACT|nr:hypothetical protein [Draconibacterium halophilum]QIA07613.1 hypothetical protein G0Q07_07685 [Draconibacterium halophilum]